MSKKIKTKLIAKIEGISITEQEVNGKKERIVSIPHGWDGARYRDWRDSVKNILRNF